MARKAWSFEYLDDRFDQAEQEKQISRPWIDFNNTETDGSFKTLLAKYKPLLDQKVDLAERLIQKYRSLVSSMSSGYDIRTLQPTNNFLLDLIDAQKKHLEDKVDFFDPTVHIESNNLEDLDSTSKFLDYATIRASILAHPT